MSSNRLDRMSKGLTPYRKWKFGPPKTQIQWNGNSTPSWFTHVMFAPHSCGTTFFGKKVALFFGVKIFNIHEQWIALTAKHLTLRLQENRIVCRRRKIPYQVCHRHHMPSVISSVIHHMEKNILNRHFSWPSSDERKFNHPP